MMVRLYVSGPIGVECQKIQLELVAHPFGLLCQL
jgi:hypothetical protein